MIPLRDDNPTRTFPLITVLLIVANVLVYLWQVGGGSTREELITGALGCVPREISQNVNLVGVAYEDTDGHIQFDPLPSDTDLATARVPNEAKSAFVLAPSPHPLWITIFTSMFMHASIMHIAGNMLFLWIFGNNVEDALGKKRFLLFYLFGGIIASLSQTFVDPSSIVPTVGASGAIAAVLGAYIVMYPGARVLTLFMVGLIFLREVSAFWVLAFWIGLQIVTGVAGFGGEATGGVAYFAHIGGFATGVLVTLILGGKALGDRQKRRLSDY